MEGSVVLAVHIQHVTVRDIIIVINRVAWSKILARKSIITMFKKSHSSGIPV